MKITTRIYHPVQSFLYKFHIFMRDIIWWTACICQNTRVFKHPILQLFWHNYLFKTLKSNYFWKWVVFYETIFCCSIYILTVYKMCNGWKKILRNIGFKTNLFILRHWSIFESSWNDVWFLSCLFISFLCMVVFFYLTYYFCVFI